MDRHVVYPHKGTLFGNTKERNTEACYNVVNFENIMSNERSQSQKTDHILHDSLYIKYSEQTSPERQKVNWWLSGTGLKGWEVTANGCEVSSEGDENVLKLDGGVK